MSEKELRNKVDKLTHEEIKELAYLFLVAREKTRLRATRHRERKRNEKMKNKGEK